MATEHERPTVEGADSMPTDERAENFVPGEQIVALLRPGMTGTDVARAVILAAGLPEDGDYHLLAAEGTDDLPMHEAIKRGAFIIKGRRDLWRRNDEDATPPDVGRAPENADRP